MSKRINSVIVMESFLKTDRDKLVEVWEDLDSLFEGAEFPSIEELEENITLRWETLASEETKIKLLKTALYYRLLDIFKNDLISRTQYEQLKESSRETLTNIGLPVDCLS